MIFFVSKMKRRSHALMLQLALTPYLQADAPGRPILPQPTPDGWAWPFWSSAPPTQELSLRETRWSLSHFHPSAEYPDGKIGWKWSRKSANVPCWSCSTLHRQERRTLEWPSQESRSAGNKENNREMRPSGSLNKTPLTRASCEPWGHEASTLRVWLCLVAHIFQLIPIVVRIQKD